MSASTKTSAPAEVKQEQAEASEGVGLETSVSEIGGWGAETSGETEGEVETSLGTEAPTQAWDLRQLGESPWIWAALGLVLVLAACVVWRLLRGKTRPTQTVPTEPAAGTQHAGIDPAVLWELGAREDQQDAYGMSDPAKYAQQGMIAVVADGMGGLSNGGMVSATLVRSCIGGYEAQSPQMQPADRLLELLTRANEQVNRMLIGKERSGSTLVTAMIKDGYLDFLTVGDSHLYLCRGGGLILLNREHVYREDLALRVSNRQLAPQQIELDRQKKSLTSYLGIGQLSHLDRNCERIKLLDGDKLLLCSDGVFGTLSTQDMERALALSGQAAVDALREMVNTANRSHQDNFTAVVLEYHG